MSRFFISRPIFASVISIVIVIAGLMASLTLPVAQYPEITPPTVIISATFPGANAETLSKTVAAPIEEQLSGVEGLLYYNSQSTSNGTVSITATFEVGTNPDTALIAVNNRVKVAEPRLPDDVRRTGVLVQKRSNNILMFAALRSPDNTFDALYLSNYVSLNVVEEIRRIPGVGDAQLFDPIYAMRVWLKPDVMAKLGVTTSDVAAAIRVQNAQNAAGKIGAEPVLNGQQLTYTVTAKGRLLTPEDFGNIVLRAEGPNGLVRLKDVARIELGADNYDRSARVNGSPVSGMGIYLQSGANALQTAKLVRARLDEMSKQFPKGMEYFVPYDTTRFIQESAKEVIKTLVEAALLVIAVVYLFLQNWRATLIPIVAVPVSLIGTFAGMWLFGFSINTLTLFAMVLAIGIVVDDAIVVLENVERLMNEQKMSPKDAAIEAMREVSGAVIAIVLVLCAVFVPVAFLGGIAGMLYKQFAVTVAVAVVISGIVALTLTPALCALLLKPTHEEKPLFRPFNRLFERFTRSYTNTVGLTLRHGIVGTLVFLLTIGAAAWLLRVVPGSFVPSEDQGYLFGFVTLSDGASGQRTGVAAEQMRQRVMSDDIENIFFINGVDFITGNNRPSVATTFIIFKPWDQRTVTTGEMAGKFMGIGMSLPDGMGLVFNPPPIQGLGTAGGFEVYVQNRADGDPRNLAAVTGQFVEALKQRPELTGLNTFFRVTAPQLYVEVDEPKALSMGIPLDSIYATLQASTGVLYVNDFNRSGKTYKVQVQADAAYRMKPEDLLKPYVRSASGAMVPLSAVAKVKHHHRRRAGGALQWLRVGQGAGQRRPGLQLRRRHQGRRGSGSRHAARRLSHRVGRPGLPGKAHRQRLHHRLRVRHHHGLPDPGGPVRKVVPAPGGDHGGALRHAWCPGGGADPRHAQRHLLPDRAGGADRAGGQERHPDRRVRRPEAGRRHERDRCGRRGSPAALPPHRDDLPGLHPRRAAPGHLVRAPAPPRGARWAPAWWAA
jgi:hydrophobe/amphiphile efflux-1 (HAE1) family protein